MSDKEKQDLQNKILELENYVKETKQNIAKAEENIKQCEKAIQALKDIAWERESKKESSKMYKVLENEKSSTIVKSNVGDVVVDREFMEKEIHKHLDNPALRGMVTTEEMLSFPKVARNVGAEFNPQYQGYTWKVKADDEKTLIYGEREYEIDGKDTHRLLTNYSESEKGQRKKIKAGVGERGHSHRQINDPDFLRPADESIAQNKTNLTEVSESALKRMQQKIDAVAQKGFSSNTKAKQQSIDKGKDR
ncbi:hypothetical protein [Helicobacter typhlonius]|uniref:hypothetical protein n=1 Tax=Helicobacter typhlonius TaxID=76936 RepID=UPI002FDFA030